MPNRQKHDKSKKQGCFRVHDIDNTARNFNSATVQSITVRSIHEWCVLNRLSNANFDAKLKKKHLYILTVHDCFKRVAVQDIFLLGWRQVLSYDVLLWVRFFAIF
jgi:hypothetical protein